jgi:hypothetical protein
MADSAVLGHFAADKCPATSVVLYIQLTALLRRNGAIRELSETEMDVVPRKHEG